MQRPRQELVGVNAMVGHAGQHQARDHHQPSFLEGFHGAVVGDLAEAGPDVLVIRSDEHFHIPGEQLFGWRGGMALEARFRRDIDGASVVAQVLEGGAASRR